MWSFYVIATLLQLTPTLCQVHAGAALNIFQTFGDLGSELIIKPNPGDFGFPHHDFIDVFEQIHEIRSPFLVLEDDKFNGQFLLQLCESVDQLKAALYSQHKVAGTDKAWRAFTGGWSKSLTASYLGVNSSYLTGSHGYTLVRLNRHHDMVRVSPDSELHFNQWATEGAKIITPGLPGTVFDFFQAFGSHYIDSYITGDSLYQVFIFTPSVFEDLRKVMKEYEDSGQNLDKVLDFFSPWHVEHMGRITSLSGNTAVELWAERNLRSHLLVFVYSSLLNLHSAPDLLEHLDYLLGNDTILSVDLRSLAPFIIDKQRQILFEEVLDNHMKLWELSV